ncbi:MAG: hypothetical protein EU540_00530 [Promethearchaeota archaeon]|nr:MAG: hypothetical protein EU540_00530 [Candidatus Lokiarchaeota archaeon]
MPISDILTFPHFWVMLIGIALLALSIIVVTIHKPEKWFLLHKTFAMAGIILTLIGLLVLMGLNFILIHAIFGLVVIVWLIGEILGGYVASKKQDKNMRKMHILAGRIVFLIAIIVLIFGILAFI